MKIETIGRSKNIIEKQQLESSAPKFVNGEIFVAQIMEKQGNSVMLKYQNGTLFMAKMQEGMGISEGDTVEIIVRDAKNGHSVLQVLDIDRGDVQKKSGSEAAKPQQSKMYAGAMKQDQKVSTKILLDTLAMMKTSSNLAPKMAGFLAANSISNSPENIEALVLMMKGEQKIGDILSEIDQTVQSSQTQIIADEKAGLPRANGQASAAQPWAAADAQAATTQTQNAKMPGTPHTRAETMDENILSAKASEQILPEQIKLTQAKSQQTPRQIEQAQVKAQQIKPQQIATQQIKPEQAGQQKVQQTNIQSAQPQREVKTHMPAQQPTIETEANIEQQVTQIKGTAQKILSMFWRPGSDDMSGVRLKKAITSMPGKLEELKTLLEKSHGQEKDALLQKIEQLEKQDTMMAEVKRFSCLHIPFYLHGQSQATAELYIYRHKPKKDALDAQNIVILLGLDTQSIGRVETMIKVLGKNVSLKFSLENINIAALIEKSQEELTDQIEDAGFKLTDMRTGPLEVKTTLLNAEEVLADLADVNLENLDIRI